MNDICKTFEKRYLLVAVLSVTAGYAAAQPLGPGQSETIEPGDQPVSWNLESATLTVNPGGQTLGIISEGTSILVIDQGTIRGVGAVGAPETSRGIWLRGGNATITGSTITSVNDLGLSANESTGVAGPPASTVTVINSSITGRSRGVNITSGSTLTMVDSQVSGSGTGAGGIVGDGVGMAVLGATANVQGSSITGSNRGIVVSASGSAPGPSLITLDNTSVTGTQSSAILVNAVTSLQPNATFVVQNGSSLTGANGIMLEVGQTGTTAPSTVNFTADNSALTGDIVVTGPSIAAITLRNNASTVGNMTNITSLGMDSSSMTGNVLQDPGSTASVTMINNSSLSGQLINIGSLDMNNSTLAGSVTSASGSNTRVSLTNGSTLTGQLSNIAALNIDQSLMTGDVVQDNATPAVITLSNSGTLTGSVSNAQTMSLDATSRWNMINDSSVGSLVLNGGTVNLQGANAGFRTLTLGELSGAGTFALGTDLAGHLSDLVNVTGNASGSHILAVQNTGVDPVQEDHAQLVVHTGSGNAVFAVQGGVVDVGTFQYRLQKRGSDWFLVQATTTDPTDPTDPIDPTDPGDPVITPSTRAVIGLFSAAPTVWYGELTTLRSRMGELRNGHTQGGLWSRAYGNKFSVSTTDQVNYQQNQQGISFGIDTPLPGADGQWLMGVMAGYSRSNLDLQLGTDGEVNSYYLGLYSTWLSTSGYYIDAVIKANRFENKADVRMSDSTKAEGDYSTYGFGGSIEGGKHIKLDDNWFIEPYAQVSTLWVSGEHYDLDNGMQARSNHADSLLGKVGTHVGRTFPLSNGGFAQPYVKLAVAQEFLRSNKVKVNRTTFSDDLSGTRGEIGAGLAAQLSDVLQLHADVDYSNGEKIEQPWGVNVGIRYSW